MHEMALADELIRTVERELAQAGVAERVLELRLAFSRFSCINPDALRFAFSLLSSGSALSEAVLEFTVEPVILSCRTCGNSAASDDFVEQCPRCGSHEVSFGGARGIRLESIEVEDSVGQKDGGLRCVS
jgi:hydrogenase nickel incorporation protein HypA/HybF